MTWQQQAASQVTVFLLSTAAGGFVLGVVLAE
jgi:hypothetical protein